jgi:uncharacterized membrane protein HdeD (DUF308 family)
MAQTQSTDISDLMTEVARHWGWVLGFGILTLIVGVLVIIWPGETVLIAAILFGIQLVVAGIFRFVAAFVAPIEQAWVRVLTALLAILSFIVGIYLLRHPYYTVVILAVLLGIYWLIHGVIDLFTAIGHRELQNRGLTIFTGILSIVAGVIVLANPAISLVFLAWVLGIWLVVLGILGIIQGIRLRSLAHAIPTSAPAPGAA